MKLEHMRAILLGNSLKFYKSKEWKHKRLEIIERDNHECQYCKELGKLTIENKVDTIADSEDQAKTPLEVHHIEELKSKPELGLDDDNLITLCINCHNVEHERFGSEAKHNKIAEDIPERW